MVTGIDSFKEWFKGSEEQYNIQTCDFREGGNVMMKQILDFTYAAVPWVATGLMVVILGVKSRAGKREDKK